MNTEPCASQVVKQIVTGNDNISVEQILLVGVILPNTRYENTTIGFD